MGSGKKNKRGGAPKKNGRLAAALTTAQSAAAARARSKAAEEKKQEIAQAKASALNNAQQKKKRKLERALEQQEESKGKARAEDVPDVEAFPSDEEEEIESMEKASEKIVKDAPKMKSKPRRKGVIPYKPGQRILLVGEGNFSFAHSLLLASPAIVTPHLLVATAYDSEATAQEKYPDLMHHVTAIRAAGASVLFGVDATKLSACKEIKQFAGSWDKVVFNFPHVGQGITDQDRNVRANQTLILQFFKSVAPILRVGTSAASDPHHAKSSAAKKAKILVKGKGKRARAESEDEDEQQNEFNHERELFDEDEDVPPHLALTPAPPTTSGTVLITLRTISPYSLWSLQHLGTRGSLLAPSILPRPLPKTPQPNYLVVRSFEFDPADYPGYEHRRTVGFKEGISSAANDDLKLSARERGELRRREKEEKERDEKESRNENSEPVRNGGKALMRTWEFELVPTKDTDDLYD